MVVKNLIKFSFFEAQLCSDIIHDEAISFSLLYKLFYLRLYTTQNVYKSH